MFHRYFSLLDDDDIYGLYKIYKWANCLNNLIFLHFREDFDLFNYQFEYRGQRFSSWHWYRNHNVSTSSLTIYSLDFAGVYSVATALLLPTKGTIQIFQIKCAKLILSTLSLYFNNYITAVFFYSHCIIFLFEDFLLFQQKLVIQFKRSQVLWFWIQKAFSFELQCIHDRRLRVGRIVAPSEGELVPKHLEIVPEIYLQKCSVFTIHNTYL